MKAANGAFLADSPDSGMMYPHTVGLASHICHENFDAVCAADYLITRDNDLLVLKHWKDTSIILPEDFLPLLRTMSLLD